MYVWTLIAFVVMEFCDDDNCTIIQALLLSVRNLGMHNTIMLSCEDRAPEEALLHAFYMYWDKGEPDLTILLLSPSQLRLHSKKHKMSHTFPYKHMCSYSRYDISLKLQFLKLL